MQTSRACAVFVLAILSAAPLAAEVEYRVVDLGTFDGESFGYALNEWGHTTGKSKTSASQFHAFFRQATSCGMHDLGTFGGTESVGYGINDAHQVAGWSRDAQQNFRAFRWTDLSNDGGAGAGEVIDLGTLGGDSSGAYAINTAGQVAGQADRIVQIGPIELSYPSAFLWTDLNSNNASDPGEMINLGTLTGVDQHRSYAFGLNDHGAVVGSSQSTADLNPQHAFYWQDTNNNYASDPGEMIDLGTLGGATSIALDVNDNRQVVGSSHDGSITMATMWRDTGSDGLDQGDILGLGTLGGGFSEAKSINNIGQVVGYSETGLSGDNSQHAFIYREPSLGMQDLNDLIDPASGWTLQQAWEINDRGSIVGYGVNASTGDTERAFLLEPTTYIDLPGDYNNDRVVDAADYTVWRDHLGADFQLQNEAHGVTPGLVTVEDFHVWRAFYGEEGNSGGGIVCFGSFLVQAPEPTAVALLLLASLPFLTRRR